MSRALDNETAAALQSGHPTAAYAAISGLLTEPATASTDRLEIELLGRGHPLPLPSDNGAGAGCGYFLRDGNAVAIHKLALVQAFFVARKILLKHQASASTDDPMAVMAATAVILLFDPEHLTAANTRKHILQARIRDGRGTASALADELRFVDSLLTSHLHRHTKSPTLWNHRRWLVSEDKNSCTKEITLRTLTDIVMVAAVRHPRNYYAWDHARWLVAQSRDRDTAELLLPSVRDWCYRHHDDTSGWSFLLFLLLRPGMPQAHLDETLMQVEHMAASLQWTGESVWVFLRTAATATSTATATDSQSRFRQTAQVLQRRLDPASQDWRVLQQAQNWRTAYPTASVRRGSS